MKTLKYTAHLHILLLKPSLSRHIQGLAIFHFPLRCQARLFKGMGIVVPWKIYQASEAKNGRKAVALRLPGREPLQIHGKHLEDWDGKMRFRSLKTQSVSNPGSSARCRMQLEWWIEWFDWRTDNGFVHFMALSRMIHVEMKGTLALQRVLSSGPTTGKGG